MLRGQIFYIELDGGTFHVGTPWSPQSKAYPRPNGNYAHQVLHKPSTKLSLSGGFTAIL